MFTIPVIIISTITGTANFAQGMFGNFQTLASVIIGSMNIIAGIVTTIYQFLKVAELNEGHKAAALGWE
jgi:Na+-transporting NADH:ubiquinone oxidoreductase subunit NqrD